MANNHWFDEDFVPFTEAEMDEHGPVFRANAEAFNAAFREGRDSHREFFIRNRVTIISDRSSRA